ncbi:MAG: hypothetical protein ACLPKT_22100 [Methylocella sp.]
MAEIQPTPKLCAACKSKIESSFDKVLWAKLLLDKPRPKPNKQFRSFAKKVRAIEKATGMDFYLVGRGNQLDEQLQTPFMKQVKKFRVMFEEWADKADQIKSRHGSKRRSQAKQVAADQAYFLLTKFASRPPTLTRGGPWNELAVILYDENKKADLYDYLVTSPYHIRREKRRNPVAI